MIVVRLCFALPGTMAPQMFTAFSLLATLPLLQAATLRNENFFRSDATCGYGVSICLYFHSLISYHTQLQSVSLYKTPIFSVIFVFSSLMIYSQVHLMQVLVPLQLLEFILCSEKM